MTFVHSLLCHYFKFSFSVSYVFLTPVWCHFCAPFTGKMHTHWPRNANEARDCSGVRGQQTLFSSAQR